MEDSRRWINEIKSASAFFLFVGSPLLLSALGPRFASSNEISFTKDMPQLLRESFWTIEALTLFLSGITYRLTHRWLGSRMAHIAMMVNSLSLFLFFWTTSPLAVAVVLLGNALLFNIAFAKGRDDLIIENELPESQIQARTAVAFGYKSLIQAFSPIVLTFLFTSVQISQALFLLLSFQLIFVVAWLQLITTRKKITDVDVNRIPALGGEK